MGQGSNQLPGVSLPVDLQGENVEALVVACDIMHHLASCDLFQVEISVQDGFPFVLGTHDVVAHRIEDARVTSLADKSGTRLGVQLKHIFHFFVPNRAHREDENTPLEGVIAHSNVHGVELAFITLGAKGRPAGNVNHFTFQQEGGTGQTVDVLAADQSGQSTERSVIGAQRTPISTRVNQALPDRRHQLSMST